MTFSLQKLHALFFFTTKKVRVTNFHFFHYKNCTRYNLHFFFTTKIARVIICIFFTTKIARVITDRLFFALTTNLQPIYSLQLLTVRVVIFHRLQTAFVTQNLHKSVQLLIETHSVFIICYHLLFTTEGTFFQVSLTHTPPWTYFAFVLLTVFF